MAWSSSLNNKFAKIQPKKEEKKQNSSFYDDFQSRRSENSGGLASTPSVKSTSSNTSSSKKTSSSSKQSGSSSGSKKTAPTTTFGNSTKFFKGYQTYQERKKSGNVFTPSTVMGKTAISDKPKMSEIIPNVTIDLEKKLGNLITNYEKIATSEGSPSEKAKRIHEFIADNQDTFNEYSKQTGGDLTIPGLEYMYQKYVDKITRQMRVDNNDKESTLRPATLKDLTVNSFTRGITNTMYGEENYKAIAGKPNNAQQYKQELSQDKYQFAPKGLFQKAVSGTSEQLGQMFRNAASPETSAAVAGAAAIALFGGQAGPQAALPEEVITVPSAIAAGYKAGSSASALKTEAGLAYAEMIDNGITPETASKIALGVGTVNSGLEAMQLDDLMKSFKILSKSSATKGIAKQLGEYILKRGGHITTETAQEMAQEATTIAGTQLANKIEKGEWAYNADEVSDRITDTGKSSLLTFAGLGGIGDIAHIGTNAFNVAADNYNNTVQTGQAINNAGAAQDMVDIGLKRDANTSANKYAQKMQQKQSKGADLSDWNVGRQYQKNVKAIDAENKFINDIANVTGTETQVHADMGGVNGQFTSDNGQQRVDISANGDTSVPATVKHEFTHLFKQNAGEAYQAFEDYMYKSAMETNPQAVQDRLASLKTLYEKNGLQYTDEIGREEIVAEMTDTFEPNVNKIAYGNPNLADKVLNGIRTAKAHLQSALSSPYTNNRTGVQMTYAQLNNAEQLWNNALRQAAENKGNVDSNSVVKNSAKESADITNHKEKQLEIILNRNPALNEYSTWVRNIDDIKTFEETLLDDDWEDGEDFAPDYTWDMAQEAVKTGDITVYSSHPIEQGIFVTPSRMEAESYSGNGNIYEKNVRLSDIAWIDPTQGQYAKIDDKIVKNSVKENTSDAQTKSDNFKQWFGDWENDPENASKVVNDDGTPKVVYHGTNSDFTTFDTQRFNTRENSGDYVGEGFFFADKESTAKKYGSNVMPVYLNLRNPLIINTEQDGENFRSTFLNMYQKGDKELRDLIGGDYDYFSIMEENPSAIRKELQRRGYDGLIDNLYGQYAVFNPNQIKSATDNIGTFDRNNDDIRYSLKENDLSTDKCQKRFAENVDKVFSGEMPKRTVITVGDTPNLLQKYGANDVPITINQSTMYKIAYPTGYFGAEKQGHNLGIPALKQLPKQIAEPTAILKSNSQDDSMILLTEWEDTHGNPVIIPLRLDKQGEVSFENNISSAYGKQNFDALLTDKQGNSTVLYTQNNEDIQNLIVDRLQLPAAPKEDTLVNYNISNPEENVKFSIKESRDNKADSMAADIIKSNNSTLKKSDISGEIEEIYSILTNGNVTDEKFQNAWSMAENVGRRIAETSQITDADTSDEYKRLLNWVRNTPVSISDTDKADIGGVDSFNEFRKKNFGSIRLTNSGTPIDIAYQELSQQFPQYFDAQNETHPADQLTRIQDILQDLKPTMRTLSDEERSGVADDVAVKLITDIMNNNDIQLSDSNFFDDMPNGKKLSQLFTNTMQKGAYTGEFKSEAERRKTEFMYEGITNKETYEAAQADISNRGDDTVLAELSMKDGGWSAEDTAKSLALMAKYQSENNTSKAVDVASMLREKMTQAGQAVQALKIVNKLTPEGQFLDFVRQAEKMVDEQIEKHPANDKIRKELNAAKKKDQARQKKTKETDREHFIPREAEVDTSVPEIDEKYKYGEQETLIPKEPIADDNTEPSIGTPVNGEQETLIPKSYYDEVLDKWKIDHLSAEDMQQVNDTLKTLDTLDDKNDLINLILKQSKERKTASHALVKKALEGQNIEFLKDTALMQVFGKISDKMPSSLAQKASTYQAMSHLLNARTMMRNITSNTAFNSVDRISTDIGSIVDSLIGVFSGKRTVGVDRGVFEKGRFRASADRAAQQYLDIALAVNHETDSSKYNLNSARRTFKGRAIGGLERGMSYGLQVTDEWSKGGIEYNIKKSLERLKKSGFTAEEIDNIAKFEAKYRTFQDDTKLGQILKGLKDTLNVIGVGETKQLGRLKSHEFGLGDLVQKYTQVPGALITRSVEYSPLGYCKALYNIGKAVYNKSKGADFSAADQRNIALSLGRAMTGTGLIALFAGLSGLGIFTGEREDKDEKLKAMENAEGISNTQLNLSALSRLISSGGKDAGGRQNGDVLTSLGFLEPLSTLMAMGNAVAEKGSVKNPVDWASAATAKTFDQIMDMSTMSTMRSISNTLTYGGNGWDVAVGTLTDSATGFIPGPVRQLGSFLDTTQRNPYNEENSTDKARERFKASLPWARENVAAKINPYGEEKTTSSGNRAIDFLNNFFSPGYVNIYQTGDISEELYRLSEQSTDVLPHVPAKKFDVNGVTYKPRGKEYEKYSRLVGTITAQKMRDIINADNYEDMSDADKVEALSKAAKDGEKEAKQQYATGEFATVSSGTFRMTEPSTVTAKQQEMQAKQEQQQRAVSQLQTVADNLAAAVPDKADEYSVNSLQINDIKSAKIDGKSYDISGETESKVIAAANEEHYSNIEKLMNNEINVEDVVGYTSKGKARTSKQADGTKVSLTGKMYNDDGTPRFDELVTAKIIYQSKEAAKEHAAEKYRDEITGAASQPMATDEPVKVSQSTGGRARFTSARASGGSSSGRRKSGGTSTGSRSSSGGSSRVQFTARANTGNTSGTAPIGTRSAVSLPNTVNPQLIQAAVDSFMKNKNVSNAVKPLENPLFM